MRGVPILLMVLLLGASAHAEEAGSILDLFNKPAEKTQGAKAPAAAAKKTAPKPAASANPKAAAATSVAPVPLPAPHPQTTVSQANKAEPAVGELAKAQPGKSEAAADSAMSPAERQNIQAALLWSGDYTGEANGEDPLVAAVKNYQKRIKGKVTGVLTPAERAGLLAAAGAHQLNFGWSVVIDPATGVRIGLPTKMVPHAQEAPRGTRWSSVHGDVQVETFRVAGRDLKLGALFEQEKHEPASRKIEYSVLRDDDFFISGYQGLKKFSVKAQLRDGEVRGFTMMYDQMMETIVTPVMVAMSAAFSPFPERSAPFAALAKSVEYGNGLVVSAQGHIVTDRKLTEGCQVVVASGIGDAVRVVDDKDTGLALLRVYAPRKLWPLTFASGAASSSDVSLVGIPDPKDKGDRTLTEIKARLVVGGAIELRQPVPMAGFSGAAALDAQGRFVGMTDMRNAVLASIDPSLPPVRLVPAQTIRSFLSSNHVGVNEAPAGDGKSSDVKASVVRIICVRK